MRDEIKMNSKKGNSILILVAAGISIGCNRVQPVEVALQVKSWPIFGVDAYSINASSLGTRQVQGAILSNCVPIFSFDELRTNPTKIILLVQEDLPREFLDNECRLQTTKPGRPNITLQFLTTERFAVFFLDEKLEVTNRSNFYWQNVKVLAKRNKT